MIRNRANHSLHRKLRGSRLRWWPRPSTTLAGNHEHLGMHRKCPAQCESILFHQSPENFLRPGYMGMQMLF